MAPALAEKKTRKGRKPKKVQTFICTFKGIASKSAFSLCIHNSIASLKKVCVMLDHRKLFNLRMAENVRSAVADVTGMVGVMCRS